MQKRNFIIIILAGLFFINTGYAGVRFITETGERETFKSKCSPSYVTCVSPKEGVGIACEGKYSSCKCPSTYIQCETPKTGGTSAGCDGKFLALDCQCPSEYDTLCDGANNSVATGAISCDGKYKSADCKCPNGWVTSCTSPKVLSGATCTADSLVYRETCNCPNNYLTCSNGGAIGASSCTDNQGTKYTSCKADDCPSGTVDVNTYWNGKLKYIMDTTTGTQSVGTKKCKALPTCASFGYSSTAAVCGSQTYLNCPFDDTKKYCPDMVQPTATSCADLGYDDVMSVDMICERVSTTVGTCFSCVQNNCYAEPCANNCITAGAGDCKTSCQTSCSQTGTWGGQLIPAQYDAYGNELLCALLNCI